jgi:hypothetical protein
MRPHLLAALLAVTAALAADAPAEALGPGRVPAPTRIDAGTVAVEPLQTYRADRWASEALDDRLLDAIAPLGDGPDNAARTWRDFSPHDDARRDEAAAARKRVVTRSVNGREHRGILPWADPLVQEALPAADCATACFHPCVWPVPSLHEPRSPVLHVLTVGLSWLVHGLESGSGAAAREDFRRVVRLGRLPCQEDADVIHRLVGLRLIRQGLEALHEEARRAGDRDGQLLIALALLDVDSARGDERNAVRALSPGGRLDVGQPVEPLHVDEESFTAVVDCARRARVRRWRLVALGTLHSVLTAAAPELAARAEAALRDTCADGDPMVAAYVRGALHSPRRGQGGAERVGGPARR